MSINAEDFYQTQVQVTYKSQNEKNDDIPFESYNQVE